MLFPYNAFLTLRCFFPFFVYFYRLYFGREIFFFVWNWFWFKHLNFQHCITLVDLIGIDVIWKWIWLSLKFVLKLTFKSNYMFYDLHNFTSQNHKSSNQLCVSFFTLVSFLFWFKLFIAKLENNYYNKYNFTMILITWLCSELDR